MKYTSIVLPLLLSLLPLNALAGGSFSAGHYSIDPMHSKIGFEVTHLVISSVEGRFNSFQGEITMTPEFQDSKFNVNIDTASIDTGIQKRDDHLRSAEFFEVEKFPRMTFKSKTIEGTPEAFKATGDLTIKGMTREIALDGKYLGSVKDAYGAHKAAFEARTKISRKSFGLSWNKAVEAGPVIGDEVIISLKIQAAKK